MPTVQQSIEIKVPVHAVYNQLMQFEDYPRFMGEVGAVERLDDTHLHWKAAQPSADLEWDAEITEQQTDRCIAWHNINGPTNAGKIEVQAAGPDISRVVFTLQAEQQQVPGSPSGASKEEMAQRLKMDLKRLKELIESRGAGAAAWSNEIHDSKAVHQDCGPREMDKPTIGVGSLQQETSPGSAGSGSREVEQSTQSDYSLSKSAENGSADDGRFSVAAEVNLDQQTDAVRQVGKMPRDTSADHAGSPGASEAMREAMQDKAGDRKE